MEYPQHWSDRMHHQAVLYTWCLEMLPLVRTGGVLSTADPAPLDRRDIGAVLRLVRQQPEYRGQTILVHANDGHAVCLRG